MAIKVDKKQEPKVLILDDLVKERDSVAIKMTEARRIWRESEAATNYLLAQLDQLNKLIDRLTKKEEAK